MGLLSFYPSFKESTDSFCSEQPFKNIYGETPLEESEFLSLKQQKDVLVMQYNKDNISVQEKGKICFQPII